MAAKTEESEAKAEDKEEGKGGGGKLKLILMLLPTVLLAVALAYFMFLKPSGTDAAAAEEAAAAEATSTYVPGVVVPLDAITINLAGGHFLKLGMTLQASAEAAEAPSGAKALDAAIELYSGMAIEEISTAKGRDKTKKELVEKVTELYEKEIYDVYFTTFVYQ